MWTDELFHVKKPIIALLHLRALPGDPLYEKDATMGEELKQLRRHPTAEKVEAIKDALKHFGVI